MPNPIDLGPLKALHAAAKSDALVWAKFTAALDRQFPALAAELQSLRARVAELEDWSEMLEKEVTQCMGVINTNTYPDLVASGGFYGKLAAKSNAERDLLRAERDAARDEIAGLREALQELADLTDATVSGDYTPDSFTSQPARFSLARTPYQHRKAIEAGVLLEVLREIEDAEPDTPALWKVFIQVRAERLKKEAGNG